MVKAHTATYKTSMRLTKTATEKMGGFGISECSFFVADKPFKAFIERYPSNADGELSVALILDRAENVRLTGRDIEGSIVLHAVFTNHNLLVTNLTMRKSFQALGTNWQREEYLVFDRSRDPAPVSLINLINRMTPAKESSDYVKKRIGSWEGYLKIQERGMDIPDIKTAYSNLSFSHDFSRITLKGCQLKDTEWKQLKNLTVRLVGISGDVGTVVKAANRIVEIELQNYIVKQLRKNGLSLDKKEVVFSNFAALSQIRRLRQGFTNLEKGLAVNPNLDRLLFEEKPPVKPLRPLEKLSFHNQLNEFQQRAVSGAMAAEDLYVIQGPPGTGKTTVISEICLQNARKGLRTLVASQSNLAVDNALGRLLANKDIRILRVGRTESIEEEGKKFIEENVGQYWKDHTLEEITAQYDMREKREPELKKELVNNEQATGKLQPVYESLAAAVEEKTKAQDQQQAIQKLLEREQVKLTAFELQKGKAVNESRELAHRLHALEELIDQDSEFMDRKENSAWFQEEQQRIHKRLKLLERALGLPRLEQDLSVKRQDLAVVTERRDQIAEIIEQKNVAVSEMDSIKKIDGLLQVLKEQRVEETPSITYLINRLEANRENMAEWGKLNQYNEQVTAAISYIEKLVVPAGISVVDLKQQALEKTEAYTSAEIDGYLEKLRTLLKSAKHHDPAILQKALTGLYRRQNDLWRRGAKLKAFDVYATESKRAFHDLKKQLCEELGNQQKQYRVWDEKLLEQQEKKQEDMAPLEQRYRQMPNLADLPADLEAAVREQKMELTELQKNKALYEKVQQRITDHQTDRTEKTMALENNDARIAEMNEEIQQVEAAVKGHGQQLLALSEILSSDVERRLEQTAKKLASLSFAKESLKQEMKNLPLLQSVQKKWLDLLAGANEHDLDEIRKMYIKHANVIGTTCVASARKDFIDNYPEFDVVIIDEVSKATPPELLLPMLKGQKIILVGDHHQLPPLLGNDTLEETLHEMIQEDNGFEEKKELEKLLEESLFERLYKNLPAANKTMLAIQYRMHEDIMETIAPFYRLDHDQLQCGIEDSDQDRDHLLESTVVKRHNHLMWLDLPNEEAYFEERMSGGKSLYNAAELQEIRALLIELNNAAEEAKQAGRIPPDQQKSIGVISFYGEQIKRLQRMIDQELRLPHLTVRTGTVDRFQGSERDIIVLSMVRNNQNKQGDIGFAKDYRRLNVALSRAKELLVLVGSSQMFTERAKQSETRNMYKHVLEVVKKKNGLKLLAKSGG
ncbi:ATP-dependent helicase [Planococcus antarcticus DSM 14505]|uniref:ATP-dependent helicase n=1 Tax=Planococcus antarcticus DSM 14505 TaxID=1185653 RepID=A0AA87IJD9_9BACL|nr:AAA domain-containing protein [Planococcus antarcticus]EIM05272.1 ATP-dependent helicase [Planococcus antarcticus DSM 14505]